MHIDRGYLRFEEGSDPLGIRRIVDHHAEIGPAIYLAGATGLEPATSSVTG
jgi:hypothetical protein